MLSVNHYHFKFPNIFKACSFGRLACPEGELGFSAPTLLSMRRVDQREAETFLADSVHDRPCVNRCGTVSEAQKRTEAHQNGFDPRSPNSQPPGIGAAHRRELFSTCS
jgi:hypothetical protein